jgi:hypothetical protein
MKIPKSAQKFMDEEIADDKRRRKATEKAFGKSTVQYVHAVQDACLDLLHIGFGKDIKGVRYMDITVKIELMNSKTLGRTVSSVPNMPKRVTDMFNTAAKKKMAKVLRGTD